MDDLAAQLGPTPAERPPEIRCNRLGSYPHGVLTSRHPTIVEQVRAAHPYGPRQRAALDRLRAEIAGAVRPLDAGVPEADRWNDWGAAYFDSPSVDWLDLPFLWAEGYFYVKLLSAVDYWGPAPWTGVDPFDGMKRAELRSPDFADDLAALDHPTPHTGPAAGRPADPGGLRGAGAAPDVAELGDTGAGPGRAGLGAGPGGGALGSGSDGLHAGGDGAEELRRLVLGALWGNRADLGFLIDAAPGTADAAASHLVADDSGRLVELLASGRVRRLCVLADNSGRELLADLVLLDHLLTTGLVGQIELQLKPHPYFISDATMADLLDTLRTLASGPPGARALAARLDAALREGTLVPAAHWFTGTPFEYARMPAELRTHLGTFDLVLAKGDLNYRRLVGDREWPAQTPFGTALGPFPAPLATLRTVKSDVLVGVVDDSLDRTAPGWRTTGRYALVQMA